MNAPKTNFVFLICLFFYSNLHAQVSVPYYNSFDQVSDTAGWTHYAISGTDDWKMGKPSKSAFKASYSSPNGWVTGLSTWANLSSVRVLETPLFDLSDTSGKMVISFMHMRQSYGGTSCFLEYSVNNGANWYLLDYGTAKRKNWQSSGGFSSNSSGFENAVLCIKFLQGQDSVKFRFKYTSTNTISEGWLIDNFKITKEYFNYFARNAQPIYLAQKCTNLKLKIMLGFDNQYTDYHSNTTKFFISKDSILDGKDSLLSSSTISTTSTVDEWSLNLTYGSFKQTGKYYLIYQFDALNKLNEASETDNTGFALIVVDSVYKLPYSDDFENSGIRNWRAYTEYSNTKLVWEKGSGSRHHIEGAHSGSVAWHTGKSAELDVWNCGSLCFMQYVESPYFDFSTDTANDFIISFWYKTFLEANTIRLEYTSDCGNSWNTLLTLNQGRNDDWDYAQSVTNAVAGKSGVAFRMVFTTSYLDAEGVVFDDFYAGPRLPDLSIEKDKNNRFTSSARTTDTLQYHLVNSGTHPIPSFIPQTATLFYWSTDSLLDIGDVLLGPKTESAIFDTSSRWTSFPYVKPTLTPGKYYIIYRLDASSAVNEMRESDNIGYIRIYQSAPSTIPYSNTFETQINNWRHNSSLGADKWLWGGPKGKWKDNVFSGSKAWLSSDSGNLSNMSRTHLYTPIFDLRNTVNPVMEFDMINRGDGSCSCDEAKMNMSYSTDGGANWKILDTANSSFNRWYYPMDYEGGRDKNYYIPNYSTILFGNSEPAFALANQYNSRDSRRNTRYIIDINHLKGKASVQFRFNIGNGYNAVPDSIAKGAIIDNFTIRNAFTDLVLDYNKPLLLSSKAKKVKFFMQIKNNGNYISKTGICKFYLSSNTILDSSDLVLGQASLAPVRPDLYGYLNVAYTAPQDLTAYKYLLTFVDAGNTTTETSESNNVTYWNLALDSAVRLPYINDFSDTIQVGWHQYSIGPYHSNIGDYRFRNILTPAEYLYQTAIRSQEFFTERVLSGSWNTPPKLYLESAPFNFKNDDSIFMSFDLMCTGTGSDGGTMRYSDDGGNTWKALRDQYGTGKNWFNKTSMSALNSDPGWAKPAGPSGLTKNDSTSIDISYLKGLSDVRFQFEYQSNYEALGGGTPQGMRIDNFIVEGSDIDLIAAKEMGLKKVNASAKTLNLDYPITCTGSAAGRNSISKFYWSRDSILDSNDAFLSDKPEDWVKSGTTLNTSFQITIPALDTQTTYYVFYYLDGGFKLNEFREDNNVGRWKLEFPKMSNYKCLDSFVEIHAITGQSMLLVQYGIKNNGSVNGKSTETQFYWSTDSIFGQGDIKLNTVYQGSINAGSSAIKKLRINYPKPALSSTYYLFYKADAKDSIGEMDENDNTGSFKIIFSKGTGINSGLSADIQLFTSGSSIYIDLTDPSKYKHFKLDLYNSLAQLLYSNESEVTDKRIRLNVEEYISSGYYWIRFELDGNTLYGLYYLQVN